MGSFSICLESVSLAQTGIYFQDHSKPCNNVHSYNANSVIMRQTSDPTLFFKVIQWKVYISNDVCIFKQYVILFIDNPQDLDTMAEAGDIKKKQSRLLSD